MFLKEIQKSRFRRIRIKNLLLLLVRIAIIVFLVLAFADPLLRGYSGKDSNTRKLGIIFIDSSYSMLYQLDSTNLYNKAISVSNNVGKLFTSSDEIIKIVTTVQSDTTPVQIGTKSNFNSILNKTNDILKEKIFPAAEVFIISDLQKVNFHNNRYQPDKYTNYYFIDVADNEQSNVSISTVKIESRILGLSLPVKFSAVVRNHSDNFVTNEKLILYNNDVKFDEKNFNLKPNEIKKIEFTYKPTLKGFITLKAELISENKQNDAFKEDNIFFRRIYIPEKIKIGIVSGNSNSSKYIKSVFDAANKNSEGKIKVYDYSELNGIGGIEPYDVVYLCGLKGFTDVDIQTINKFTEQGKAIVVFPSDNINIEEYNKLLNVKITKLENVYAELPIQDININSPLLDDIFKIKKGETIDGSTLDKIKLNSYYNITLSNSSSSLLTLGSEQNNKQNHDLLIHNFSNINTSAKEQYISNDNIFVFTVSADLGMSSFPQHSLFAPIILRSAYHFNPNYILPSDAKQDSSLGIYKTTYLTEKDSLESNPQLILEPVLKTALDLTGIEKYTIIPSNKLNTLEEKVRENREGKSLWQIPLIIAIALIPLEIYLSRKYSNNSN